MAIGDAGSAKGLVIYPATQAHSLGYQNDNQRADDIAAEIDARAAGDAAERDARIAALAALDAGDIATPVLGNVQSSLDYLHGVAGDHNFQINRILQIMAAHGWSV